MKRKISVFSVFLVMILAGFPAKARDIWKDFGQVPGDVPEIFAPGLISTEDFEFTITFGPQMEELYFTRRKKGDSNKIYRMVYENNEWTKPAVAFFSNPRAYEPHITPDGKRLYFGSSRPVNGKARLHQWYLEKTEGQWAEPKMLEADFVKDNLLMFLTSTRDETIYFTIIRNGPESGLFYSEKSQGRYTSAVRLGENINRAGAISTAHPLITPDEKYLIYDFKASDGFGECDLYISIKQDDGSWSKSVNLGNSINTEFCEMTASMSPDGKYLFFSRGNGKGEGNIYWVDFQKTLSNLGLN